MILGHEPESESVINRQNDKIQFLQNENIQLQEDIKDLQRALTLNQDMLKITQQKINFSVNNNASQQPPKSFSKEQTYLQDGQEAHNIAYLQEILEKKNQENKILLQTYNRCIKERNELGTKNLLHQQINEETTKFYKDVVQDIEEKVLELRRIIQDKEYTIQTLEKKIYLPDRDGVLMKIKEIVTPNEQTIPLHEEIRKHQGHIEKLQSSINQMKSENLELQSSNLRLKHELIKYQSLIDNPVSFQNIQSYLNTLNMGKQISKDDFHLDIEKTFYNSIIRLYNNKQERGEKNLLFSQTLLNELQTSFIRQQLNYQQSHGSSLQKHKEKHSGMKSPRSPTSRMDLIVQMDEVNAKFDKLKKLYFKATLNCKALIQKQLEDKKHIQRLNLQIQTLQKSNTGYESKFNSLQQQTNFYKEFFQVYFAQSQFRRRRSLDLKGQQQQFLNFNNFHNNQRHLNNSHQQQNGDEMDEQEIKEQKQIQKTQHIDNFLQDLKDEKNGSQQQNILNDFMMDDHYNLNNLTQISMKNLVQDLQKQVQGLEIDKYLFKLQSENMDNSQNIKIDNINNNQGQQQQSVRQNRSISDPNDYSTLSLDDRKEILKGWIKPTKKQMKAKKQNSLNEMNRNPFYIDMSMISGPDAFGFQTKNNLAQKKKTINNQNQGGLRMSQKNSKNNNNIRNENTQFISDEELEQF